MEYCIVLFIFICILLLYIVNYLGSLQEDEQEYEPT